MKNRRKRARSLQGGRRLTVEPLEERRVWAGLGGLLGGPGFALPLAESALAQPAAVESLAVVTNTLSEPEAAAEILPNLADLPPAAGVNVGAMLGLDMGNHLLIASNLALTLGVPQLPALDADVGLGLSLLGDGLLPAVTLGAELSITPAGGGILPGIGVDLGLQVSPAVGGLLPGITVDVEVGIARQDGGILPGVEVDIGTDIAPPDGTGLPGDPIDVGGSVGPGGEPGGGGSEGQGGFGDTEGADPGTGEGGNPPAEIDLTRTGAAAGDPSKSGVDPNGAAPISFLDFSAGVGSNGSASAPAADPEERPPEEVSEELLLLEGSDEPGGDSSSADVLADVLGAAAPAVVVPGAAPEISVQFGEVTAGDGETSPGAAADLQAAAVFDPAALEQAVQALLDHLSNLIQFLTASGLLPWLGALAAAAAACEAARRNLGKPDARAVRRVPSPWLLPGLAALTLESDP